MIRIAAFFALTAVILGAFAAHGLESKLPAARIAIFETGVRYQFYHAIGIFIAALLMERHPQKILRIAGWLFVGGIVCFSGSLYLLSCRHILDIAHWSWLGPITPLGGLLFIAGWVCILAGKYKL